MHTVHSLKQTNKKCRPACFPLGDSKPTLAFQGQDHHKVPVPNALLCSKGLFTRVGRRIAHSYLQTDLHQHQPSSVPATQPHASQRYYQSNVLRTRPKTCWDHEEILILGGEKYQPTRCTLASNKGTGNNMEGF